LNFSVDHSDARPIYVQLMDEVRRALVVGTLSPEDPLPSARQLASELKLNPNTIAQAYRELEREGVVYVRRGQGTFVRSRPSDIEDRTRLLTLLVERAILDAHRNGVSAEELAEAILERTRPNSGQKAARK